MNIIKDFKKVLGEKNITIINELIKFSFYDRKEDFSNFLSTLPEDITQNIKMLNSETMLLSEEKINIQITKDCYVDSLRNVETYFNLKIVFDINNASSITLFNESLKKELLIDSFHYKYNENTLMVEKFKDNDYSILIVDQKNEMINKKLGRKILSDFFSFVLNNNIQESIEMVNLKNDCDISQDTILIDMMKSFKEDLSIINNKKIQRQSTMFKREKK